MSCDYKTDLVCGGAFALFLILTTPASYVFHLLSLPDATAVILVLTYVTWVPLSWLALIAIRRVFGNAA